MATRIFYLGDINAAYGGIFYSLANWQWDYVTCVRITPCSDAGAADNCFWVDVLTVNIRTKPAELAPILQCCGIDELPKGAARRHVLIDAHVSYGAYDQESSECVQIGARQSEYGEQIDPNRILRGNASIRRYAQKVAREHCQ